MKTQFFTFLSGVIIAILATLLLVEKGYYTGKYTGYKQPTKTDTIHTNTIYKEIRIEPKEIAIPYEVKIYKTDTLFRGKMEKDTLISTVLLNRRNAEIHTITPDGVPLTHHYPIQDFKSIRIDHKGQAAIVLDKHSRRKKALRIASKIGLFIGGAASFGLVSR